MVWVRMSANAKTALVFNEGDFNSSRYINEVLTPHMCSLFDGCQLPSFFPDFIEHVLYCKQQTQNGLAMSPDLSCFEHALVVLGRVVAQYLE